jgi:AcrR family transcriptional regulator
MRVSKDRQTRRAELVDAALSLFLKKGYEAAMVSDIVQSVGVAQGTFYYYFKTKEDMLDAVLEKLLQEGVERAERLVQDHTQLVLQRVEGLFRMLFSPRGSIEANSQYSQFLTDPAVHTRMEEVRFRMLSPVLKLLVEAAVASGEVKAIRFPDELTEIALLGASSFMHSRKELMKENNMAADATMDALAEFMERLLGLTEGRLDFKDKVIRRHI